MRKIKIKPSKKTCIILLMAGLLFSLSQYIFAQQSYLMVDSSALLNIKKGYIYIPGNLNVHNNGKVHNEDSIYIRGNIINGNGALFESSSNKVG